MDKKLVTRVETHIAHHEKAAAEFRRPMKRGDAQMRELFAACHEEEARDYQTLLNSIAAQGQEWRDIASAPRDGGEPFWIGAPGFIALAVWNVGDGALRLVRQQIAGEPFGGEPTHWCPHALPNFIPPNPSAAEG